MNFDLVQIIIEGIKQFLIVAIAVWILTGVLRKIKKLDEKIPKEIIGYFIGLCAISAGFFTGLFQGHFLLVYAYGIVSIAVAQLIYAKFIKKVVDKLLGKINGNGGNSDNGQSDKPQ